MKIQDFPWSPMLAGFSAGVAGFGLAAVAAGFVHLGSADSCRLANHQGAAAHDHHAVSPCPCCCGGQPVMTTDRLDEAPLQLTAIEECATSAGASATTIALEPTSTVAPAASDVPATGADQPSAVADSPIVPILDRTSALSGDTTGEFNVAPTRLAARLALADPAANLAFGAAGSGSGFGSSAGGAASAGGGPARVAADLAADPAIAATTSLAALVLARDEASLLAASSLRLADVAYRDASSAGETEVTIAGPLAATGADPLRTTLTPVVPETTSAPNPAATAVPEPASLVMTLVGIGLAGGAAWRRSSVG